MADTNIVTTLDGLFKRVYSPDGVLNLVPENTKFYNMVEFKKSQKLGDSFHRPVVVKQENGYTYGGSAGDSFALEASVSGETRDANIKGFESIMRSRLSVGAASRSIGSTDAFQEAMDLVVANIVRSFGKRLEVSSLYGQKELAIVAADAANSFTVTPASWAPGIWNGVEGANIEIWSADLATLRGVRAIVGVSFETLTITYDSTDLTLTAGDRVMFKGAYNASSGWMEMLGLQGIMSAYTDGVTSLFGINPQSYNVWRATTYDAGASDLSFTKIQKAIAAGAARGLDEAVVCMVSQATWAKLISDQAAARQYDSSYSKKVAENGSETIVFAGQTGNIEIVPSAYIKGSLAFIFPKGSVSFVGSTDMTFQRPGMGDQKFFRDLENNNGYELRAYADLSLFCDAPNRLILVTGIVNS